MPRTGGHNTEPGLRGYQPKITPDQKKALMLVLVQNNWKTSIGKAFVEEELGIEVSDKGFYNWKKELFKLYESRNQDPDEPVDWGDLQVLSDLSNIPVGTTELRRDMFSIWEAIQEHQLNKVPPVTDLIEPTYRRIKWWAYIWEYHSGAIDDIGDRLYIADMYMTAEMLSDWSHDSFNRAGIDTWLLLKPWRDRQSMEQYLQLIKAGTIPPLNENIIRSAATDAVNADEELIKPKMLPLTAQPWQYF